MTISWKPAAQGTRRAIGAAAGTLALAFSFGACAETDTVRVAAQYGVTYLPLVMMEHHGLIEKHAAELGIEDLTVEWNTYSSGAAMNDALLSSNLDFAATGTPPLITIWDRTRGNIDVRGVAAFSTLPQYLVTTNPDVKTLADFTENDRIALPAVKVSIQAVTLQMAAAKEWGDENFDRLDDITVSMPHPDAATALLSGASEITAHFSNIPFQNQELADDSITLVASSFADILGGPASNGVIAATGTFVTENPTVTKAFLAALDEAMEMVSADLKGAVEDFVETSGSSSDVDFIVEALSDPEIVFTATPLNTMQYAEFMHARGSIQNKPESWKDLFFEVIHDRDGS